MSKRAKVPAVAIAACWLPGSALPKVRQATSILVAFPPAADDPDEICFLAGSLYLLHPDGRVESEEDGSGLSADEEFWWVNEAVLLAGLELHRRKAKGGQR